MGGYGSGTNSHRLTTSDYQRIDVRLWHREGWLKEGSSFTCSWTRGGRPAGSIGVDVLPDSVRLRYQHTPYGREPEALDYQVALSWSDCNYGGQRPWLLCPAVGCGRRVAVLYGGRVFACRQCHNLAYDSSRENACDRLTRKADKIRERLEWMPGCLNGPGPKPKGMRWATYYRLWMRHDSYVRQAVGMLGARFGLDTVRELGMDDYLDGESF